MNRMPIVILLACVVIAFAIGAVSGADHIVDDDAGSWRTHSTIQDAINDSAEFDTVHVYAGTYQENVIVNQTIDLIGNGTDTIINGSFAGDTVYIDSDRVNMSYFHVTGGSSRGIYMDGDYLWVHNLTVNDSVSSGIYMKRFWSTVDNCTVSDTRYGLEIIWTQWHTVKESHFENNERSGLNLGNAFDMELYNNTFLNCGLRVSGSSENAYTSHIIEDCSVDGRPILYMSEAENVTVPAGAGQVIVTGSANVTVEDQYLHNSSYGLIIGYSKHMTVRDCTLDDQYISAWIEKVDNSVFEDVRINRIDDNGLYFTQCERITVEDCNATNTWGERPLYISTDSWNFHVVNFSATDFWAGMVVYGDGTVIENSTLWLNSYGIYIGDDNITIRNNNVYNCQFGIYGSLVEWINITNNSVHGCSNHGIWFQSVENATITYNEIFDNSGYGIRLSSAGIWNNHIHHNNFADNGGAHVDTEGTHDTYDDGVSEGNYWDDWDGNGTYEVDGGNGEDRYPLSDPVNTTAPEKIPGIHLLLGVSSVMVVAAVFRRRWKP